MADSGTSGFVIFIIIVIMIWLIALTALLVAAYFGKVNIAPTGPTGQPGGPTGPTGPTGHGSGTLQSILPPIIPIQPPIMPIQTGSASCNNCNFQTNGMVSNTQIIQPVNPQVVRWVLTNNTLLDNYNTGVFTLPSGTYNLNATITYNGSVGGSYRTMAVWLHAESGQVDEYDLIGVTSALAINGIDTVLSLQPMQFTVNGLKNKFSIITWHDAPYDLTIGGNMNQFNLQKIN